MMFWHVLTILWPVFEALTLVACFDMHRDHICKVPQAPARSARPGLQNQVKCGDVMCQLDVLNLCHIVPLCLVKCSHCFQFLDVFWTQEQPSHEDLPRPAAEAKFQATPVVGTSNPEPESDMAQLQQPNQHHTHGSCQNHTARHSYQAMRRIWPRRSWQWLVSLLASVLGVAGRGERAGELRNELKMAEPCWTNYNHWVLK